VTAGARAEAVAPRLRGAGSGARLRCDSLGPGAVHGGAIVRPTLAVLLLLAAPVAAGAEASHTNGLELLAGAPLNLSAPMAIRQEGARPLQLSGAYRADAWRAPIYWALRATRRTAAGAWSLELMHHKVYLDDPPPEVGSFSVSHGFNFITLQRAWLHSIAELRAGAGVILAHPESAVRGRRYDEHQGILGAGYHLAGPAALVAVARRHAPRPGLSVSIEARASVAPAHVPIEGGEARFTNVALHLIVGIGVERPATPR
jgi:hypothetical protein